jgi:hypothetical protein
LHFVVLASPQHLLEILEVIGARFLTDNMFVSGRGAHDPFLAEAGWQGNINGVNPFRSDQFLV